MGQFRNFSGAIAGLMLSASSASAALVVTIEDLVGSGSLSCADGASCDLANGGSANPDGTSTPDGIVTYIVFNQFGMSFEVNTARSKSPDAVLSIASEVDGHGNIRISASDGGFTTGGTLARLSGALNSESTGVESKHGGEVAGGSLTDFVLGPSTTEPDPFSGVSTTQLGSAPSAPYTMIAFVEIDHTNPQNTLLSSASSTALSIIPVPAAGLLFVTALGGMGLLSRGRRKRAA